MPRQRCAIQFWFTEIASEQALRSRFLDMMLTYRQEEETKQKRNGCGTDSVSGSQIRHQGRLASDFCSATVLLT